MKKHFHNIVDVNFNIKNICSESKLILSKSNAPMIFLHRVNPVLELNEKSEEKKNHTAFDTARGLCIFSWIVQCSLYHFAVALLAWSTEVRILCTCICIYAKENDSSSSINAAALWISFFRSLSLDSLFTATLCSHHYYFLRCVFGIYWLFIYAHFVDSVTFEALCVIIIIYWCICCFHCFLANFIILYVRQLYFLATHFTLGRTDLGLFFDCLQW